MQTCAQARSQILLAEVDGLPVLSSRAVVFDITPHTVLADALTRGFEVGLGDRPRVLISFGALT